MITIGIWLAIILWGLCAILLVVLIQRSECLAKALEIQIKGLDETYTLRSGVIADHLKKLERRIKLVEDALP